MTKKRYLSDVLASVHKAAMDLAKAGLVSKSTVRAFDDACLYREKESPPKPRKRR